MAITIKKINETIKEVNKFLEVAEKIKKRLRKDRYASFGCKETAILRSASMDLSRALVEMRRFN